MLRDEAVARINDGLGFRATGNSMEATIIKRLQEAQRDLQFGKTLPWFLLKEDQTLFLAQGEHTVDYPSDYCRDSDDNRLHFTEEDSNLPRYLMPMRYRDAVRTIMGLQRPDQPAQATMAPSVYVLRTNNIDFISFADRDYTLTWDYYFLDATLEVNIENAWLRVGSAAEWLIGEAGYRIAMDLRDPDAKALFDDIRQRGRAAVFGEQLAEEDSIGPYVMGGIL